MKKQKLLVTVFAGLLFLAGAGIATAQSRGGGGMSGGGMHGGMGGGGMQGGGAWQGGGGWHGGGGNWNGGGGWHGGGGNWNGWHGGWHGANVWFGFPGTWWWPAYYPYAAYPYYGYYGYAGYPYYGGYYDGGYYGGTAGDSGDVVYIQRDSVPAAPSAPVMRNSAPGEYAYYCIDPPGYYPQVPQCTRPWLKVVPDGAPRPNPIPQ